MNANKTSVFTSASICVHPRPSGFSAFFNNHGAASLSASPRLCVILNCWRIDGIHERGGGGVEGSGGGSVRGGADVVWAADGAHAAGSGDGATGGVSGGGGIAGGTDGRGVTSGGDRPDVLALGTGRSDRIAGRW